MRTFIIITTLILKKLFPITTATNLNINITLSLFYFNLKWAKIMALIF